MNSEGNKAAKKARRGLSAAPPKPRAPIKLGNPVKVFFCVPTGMVEYYYGRVGKEPAVCSGGIHSARKPLGTMPKDQQPKGWPPVSDPAWPTACDKCGAELSDDNSTRHSGGRTLFKRYDNGEPIEPYKVVGAVIEDREYGPFGHDGRSLICTVPGPHPWHIDSRANNCTMPKDDVHRCWVRTGKPEDGTLHVGKSAPGQTTCKAGAGSIQTGQWHGFLHHGALRDC